MGFLDFLWRLLGGKASRPAAPPPRPPARPRVSKPRRARSRPKLSALRRVVPIDFAQRRRALTELTVAQAPYQFARLGVMGGFLDLSRDGDDERLASFQLPQFHTPAELAAWLQMPVGRLAWLTHRCDEGQRPRQLRGAHYHFRWIPKRGGGHRLIEAPKPRLRQVQDQILRDILNLVPTHPAAHGFVIGRSTKTNAQPHCGQRVVVKFDLANFYASVSLARVVAIFRSQGYSREAAIWLAKLTTSVLPPNMEYPNNDQRHGQPYRARHLPQGAPTSPALANLSAFSLDIRLAGLARTFAATYTRYADDLTFSGPRRFLKSLPVFLPLVRQIVHDEQFRLHPKKRRVMRDNQQQRVTGLVVNEHVNVTRREYDRLKAILTNCLRRGVSTQNHARHESFEAHLRGRIAHLAHVNPGRGEKLLALFRQVDWQS